MVTNPTSSGSWIAHTGTGEDGQVIHYWTKAMACETPQFLPKAVAPEPVSTANHLFSYLM